MNYLEFYEKYFILYNSVHEKNYKIAAQYLWLFQKLNANSLGSSDLNNERDDDDDAATNVSAAVSGLIIESDLALFKFLAKSKSLQQANLDDLNCQAYDNKYSHEQRMHFRLIITIYLANS